MGIGSKTTALRLILTLFLKLSESEWNRTFSSLNQKLFIISPPPAQPAQEVGMMLVPILVLRADVGEGDERKVEKRTTNINNIPEQIRGGLFHMDSPRRGTTECSWHANDVPTHDTGGGRRDRWARFAVVLFHFSGNCDVCDCHVSHRAASSAEDSIVNVLNVGAEEVPPGVEHFLIPVV